MHHLASSWLHLITKLTLALCFGLACNTALALVALGRIDVLSALGEPLQAEIDLPGLTDTDALNLKPSLAAPATFRAVGLLYLRELDNLQITLEKRDFRSVLKLSGKSPINSTYVDLIVEVHVSDSRSVRGYTVLVPDKRRDLPQVQVAQRPVLPVTPPTATPNPPAPATAVPSVGDAAKLPIAPVPAPASPPTSAPAPVAQTSPAPATPKPSDTARANTTPTQTSNAQAASQQRITVKSGDTAGAIAKTYQYASVSLDQMLVALLETNPEAFIDGNVNRIKSGAVLNIPDRQLAQRTDAIEASRMVKAQTSDFNEYRSRLAEKLPQVPPVTNQRETSGNLQAQVEDKKAATAPGDKLTLAKPEITEKSTEDELIRQGNQQENERQADALSKNIEALKKLSAEISQMPSQEPGKPSPAQPESQPIPQPGPSVPVSLIEKIASSDFVLLATGLLVVLLASLAFFRAQHRAQANDVSLTRALQGATMENTAQEVNLADAVSAAPHARTPFSAPEDGKAAVDSGLRLSLDESQPPDVGPKASAVSAPESIEPTESLASPPAGLPVAFDLNSINLELEQLPPLEAPSDEACRVKMALAEEYKAIGDLQGARLLLEEVLAQAQGDLALKARSALDQLG